MQDTTEHEVARLNSLRAYDILDTPAEAGFDQVTALAASLMDCPMAAISLVDQDRVWFKSRIGIDLPQYDRKLAFCSKAIDDGESIVIGDASADPGSRDNPLVAGPFGLRFYAGVPLITRDGFALGTLCVFDRRARTIGATALDQLRRLAAIVIGMMEQRRSNRSTISQMSVLLREKDAALVRACSAALQMRQAQITDALTGLGSRSWFDDHMQQRLHVAAPFSLILVDLDHFQMVNEHHGHPVGDGLLAQVAGRLRGWLPACDIVARLGSDEFAIMHVDASVEDGEALALAIVELLSRPYSLDGVVLRCTASCGIARAIVDGVDADALMRNAGRALFAAKRNGRNRASTFDAADEAQAIERYSLEQDLRSAIVAGQLRLVYQPIHDMQSGRMVGVEALARWRHPDHGDVPPDVFIPLAEETGQIDTLGLWAIGIACANAANWESDLQISVNCSPLQFRGPDLAPRVASILAETRLDPTRLDVEVTERLLLDDTPGVVASMQALRASGVQLTLDDFGAGHAGLSYVRRFHFDRIKIDRSFVEDLATPSTQAIVQTILQLSRKLGVQTLAEGVETEAQRDWLRDMGCALAQGHLYSRPLESAALASRMA